MTKIDKYIATRVFWSFLIVIFILLNLDYTLTFIGKIKQVDDNFPVTSLLQVLLYRLSGKLAEYIPISSLIGALVGLGALASTSELTVIRAAGIPIWRIGFAACQPILIFSLIGLTISQYVTPFDEQKANLIEQISKQQNTTTALTGGVWIKANKTFVYINASDSQNKLYDVLIYTPNKQILKSVIQADTAIQIQDNKWQLNNVHKTIFFPNHIETHQYKTKPWHVSIKPKHLSSMYQDPDTLSISELPSYQHYLESQGQSGFRYELVFWQKALRPLGSLVLVLVALSSVFGPLRSSTMSERIFSGIMIGLAFQNGLNLFGQISITMNFPPIIGVSIPIVICVLTTIFLVKYKK